MPDKIWEDLRREIDAQGYPSSLNPPPSGNSTSGKPPSGNSTGAGA
jgi:hypothetical protein